MDDRVYLSGKIRDRMKDLRKEKNITIAELARQVGCNETTLSRFERGETDKISDKIIIEMAKHFEVSTDFLLGEADIPDRVNYDIAELGLSAVAARNLYSRRINTDILNRMLESPRFPNLTQLIAQYFSDAYAANIAARNQMLDMTRKYMSNYAKGKPELERGLPDASAAVRQTKIDPHEMDLERIRNAFMVMLREIKRDIDEKTPVGAPATKKIVENVIENTEKGSEALPDKPIVSIEQVGGALADVTGALPGQAEGYAALIQNFLKDFTELAKQGLEDDAPDDEPK